MCTWQLITASILPAILPEKFEFLEDIATEWGLACRMFLNGCLHVCRYGLLDDDLHVVICMGVTVDRDIIFHSVFVFNNPFIGICCNMTLRSHSDQPIYSLSLLPPSLIASMSVHVLCLYIVME